MPERNETPPRQVKYVRLRTDLIKRLKAHTAGLRPRTSEVAVIEAALEEYLDRHEREEE
jgi:hypothetical protein